MATETSNFRSIVQRAIEDRKLDLRALDAFLADYEEHHGSEFEGGFHKCTALPKGEGRIPRKMRNPKTGEQFVFPILDIDRATGEIKAGEPACPKCAGKMERRIRRRDGVPFFGCRSYPRCRGACDGYHSVEATESFRTETPKPQNKKPAEPKVDAVARLKARITEIVGKARRVTEEHGITLPIGYRTSAHLAKLTVLTKDADEAWRLWIDGRVSEQERAKFDAAGLPSGSPKALNSVKDQPTWYGTVKAVLDAGLPVFLVGGAGTGKTRFAKWYAKQADKKLEMVVGSGDTAGRELWVARRDASKGETKTVEGPAARAAANGDVLLLDEIDGFDSNALLPMNAVLNGDRELSVPVLGEIEVNPEIRIIAAANTNGRTKDRTYNARNRLDGAFLNRFAVVVRTAYEATVDTKVIDEAWEEALAAVEG